jgi:hypothetical protein
MSVGPIFHVRLLCGMNRGYNEKAALVRVSGTESKMRAALSFPQFLNVTFASGIVFVVRR